FRLGDKHYRIRRTLKRAGRSTRQISERQVEPDKVSWKPIEGTSAQKGFDEWVRDHIGLNYETFTSSVLLLQGRADKLLASDSTERRKVLAGIVDLERYEKLYKRADELRKHHKEKAEELEQKLNVVAEVSDAELAEADEKIAAATAALEQARSEVERRHAHKVQGERWADLRAKLGEAQRQWDRARALLERAEGIERDWSRLQLLRGVLPGLKTILEQRSRFGESQRQSTILKAERDTFAGQLREAEYAEGQARQKRERLQNEIAAGVQRQPEVAARL